jgi:hypothetical protein
MLKMAHNATVSQMKGTTARHLPDAPRPGTRLRTYFDFLMEHKGQWIKIRPCGSRSDLTALRYQLQNTYGLDLRRRGWSTNAEWMLAGEWFGKVYVDYTAEARENAENAS